nr:YkgJ family cysteine cluster protein [Pseudodesulfovibrio sp. S3-i]
MFRRFRAWVLGREVEVVGQCTLCGQCCKDILLKDEGRWLRRKSQYEKLVASAPEHARFRLVGRDMSGFLIFSCSMLGTDNCCSCHESRPALCRNYPTKSLYYQGRQLPADCSYSFKAVTFSDVLAGRKRFRPCVFSKVLQQEIEQEKNKLT